jgi:hypothetical protein
VCTTIVLFELHFLPIKQVQPTSIFKKKNDRVPRSKQTQHTIPKKSVSYYVHTCVLTLLPWRLQWMSTLSTPSNRKYVSRIKPTPVIECSTPSIKCHVNHFTLNCSWKLHVVINIAYNITEIKLLLHISAKFTILV